jgi:hypothetical protein
MFVLRLGICRYSAPLRHFRSKMSLVSADFLRISLLLPPWHSATPDHSRKSSREMFSSNKLR